jgi:hypothetical protein
MALERYDKLFGGRRGSAAGTLKQMQKTYGRKQGEQVFYGTVAKREHRAKKTRGRFRLF